MQAEERLRALVVDDEALARDELAYMLEGTGRIEVVGQAESGEEALAQVLRLRPAVVFLDVQMPGKDGFGVAADLLALGGEVPAVVFCTAYDQYALRAFEYHALDYLLKPVDPQRLHRAVLHIERTLAAGHSSLERLEAFLSRVEGSRRPARIPAEKDGRILLLTPGEVLYAVAAAEGTTLRTAAGEFRCGLNLQELEQRLESFGFLRVHRQYLANMEKVREFVPWFSGTAVVVVGEKPRLEVPVARSQVRRVREVLGLG